jgi:hypothetical protein
MTGVSAGAAQAFAKLSALRRREDLLLFGPLALAGLFALVLLVNAQEVIAEIYRDADAASAMVISDLIDDAPPDRTVLFSNYPWYEGLWFMELTRGLPAHREIWEAAPIVAAFLAFAAVAWSALRTLGPWAGATVFALLVALGTFGRLTFFAPNWHGHTAVHVAIIGVTFVWAVRRASAFPRWGPSALALGLGAVTAPGLTDRLLLVAGIAPLVLAAVTLPFVVPGRPYVRLSLSFLAASIIAIVGGKAITEIMEDERVVSPGLDVNFLGGQEFVSNAQLFVEALSHLGGGNFFGDTIDAYTISEFVRASLVIAGFGVAFHVVRRWVESWRSGAATAATDPPLAAYTLFWGFALLGPVAVFLLSTVPEDANSGRYLVSSYIAAAALLPLTGLTNRKWRLGVTACAAVFIAVGTYQLIHKSAPNEDGYVQGADLGALRQFARAEGLEQGYGDFYVAANVTWGSHLDLKVFPLRPCNGKFRYCRHHLHVITTWYRPRQRRSFLLVDARQQRYVNGPDPAHGKPSKVRTFGQLTAYVYPYDIASALTPASP